MNNRVMDEHTTDFNSTVREAQQTQAAAAVRNTTSLTNISELDATGSTSIPPSSARSSSSRLSQECFKIANDIDDIPDPDYGLSLTFTEERENFEQSRTEINVDEVSLVASSPDYDHLGFDYGDMVYEDSNYENVGVGSVETTQQQDILKVTKGSVEANYEYVIDDGEDYILGTLMVRVLQTRNVKLHHQNDGGGISSLITNHRRTRHKKYTQSPLSGGNLTPNSSGITLYSKLNFKSQQQYTENAVPGMNGDYYWSRGDQSYFDVVCPSYKRMGQFNQYGSKVKKQEINKEEEKNEEEADDVCCKSSKINADVQKPQPKADANMMPPILNISIYSKKGGKTGKQVMSPSSKKLFDDHTDDQTQFVGKCSINVSRILLGRASYFDEWCTLHNDNYGLSNTHEEDGTGKVRVVIEYEPTDPPPRSGDVCVIANIYPAMEKELYPIPLYSITSAKPVFRSGSSTSFDKSIPTSSTTISSGSSSLSSKSLSASSRLIRQPKQFHVEECIGDHVVLSYQTPENWNAIFEIHRYNLLVTHRHCGTVEKVRENVLDFCDNISQSPMVSVLAKTAEVIPDEGLVYVGAEAVGAGMSVLGRWMEVGPGGAWEDVVDAANLDGRYSHLSDGEDEEEDDTHDAVAANRAGTTQGQDTASQAQVPTRTLKSTVAKTDLVEPSEEKEALPGMPCCPITGLPMVDPVVAADGHTYERYAIAKWFQTSNRSPLTGALMSHANLVPNYLLISSLGGDASKS